MARFAQFVVRSPENEEYISTYTIPTAACPPSRPTTTKPPRKCSFRDDRMPCNNRLCFPCSSTFQTNNNSHNQSKCSKWRPERRFATFLRDNFPHAVVTLTDLSPFYLEKARQNDQYRRDYRGRRLQTTTTTTTTTIHPFQTPVLTPLPASTSFTNCPGKRERMPPLETSNTKTLMSFVKPTTAAT